MACLVSLVTVLISLPAALSFPAHQSLAGLSSAELADVLPQLTLAVPPPGPPPALPDDDRGAKRVHDAAHPWRAPRAGEERGPCPGLNALANHGWLPRDGVATPAQIVGAVQEGFNMGHDLAVFVTYAAHLVDGNLLTDRLSIGGRKGGARGLNMHGTFEGDASLTRGDAFFGDNHSFNETLFEQLVAVSKESGNGAYDLAAAGAFRAARIRDSIARNPHFDFVSPRFFTAYAESVFPLTFFVDGRLPERLRLDVGAARAFLEHGRMPDDFFRSNVTWGLDEIGIVISAMMHGSPPVRPGANNGTVDSYTPDPTSADFSDFCKMYRDFVVVTVRGLYPDAKGVPLRALNRNLDFLYSALETSGCTQVPPFF